MKKLICCSLLMLSPYVFCAAEESAQLNKEYRLQAAQESACQGYDEEFVELVEMVYGKGFLSQGSQTCVEKMVSDLQLDGRKVLDIGSGLGAPALYLAQQYPVDIIGAEPQEWMVKRANQNLKEAQERLKGSASFVVLRDPSNLQQFSDNEFDIIFSKEALLHVPLEIKKDFFREIYRVLKPGGKIVIMDWLHSSPNYSPNTKKMMEMDGVAFNLVTPSEYLDIFKNVGFADVEMENTSIEHAGFSQENIRTIKKLASQIEAKFGKETYDYCIESWGYQRDAFQAQEIITAIFKATKK